MEQRPLRLGDLIDDYCPRERRLTNHAIVAIVGQSVRQTRCTACDAEHPFKHGRMPRPRRKDETGELYEQVLSNAGGQLVTKPDNADQAAGGIDAGADEAAADSQGAVMAGKSDRAADEADPAEGKTDPPTPAEPNASDDLWPGHRPLIRAILPRTEGQQPTPRAIPEFTIRQRGARGFDQRGGQFGGGWNDRNGQGGGQGPGRGGNGFRPGGGPPGAGGRPDGGRPRRRRGRGKRSH